MKPNTLVLGFYDSCTPDDYFLQDPAFCHASPGKMQEDNYNFGVDLPSLQAHFPPVRHVESPRWLSPEEYVGIVSDAIKMDKNVCLGRYLFELQGEGRDSKVDGSERTIDVWPLNLLQLEESPSNRLEVATATAASQQQQAAPSSVQGGGPPGQSSANERRSDESKETESVS
jgi:hypothetical protein